MDQELDHYIEYVLSKPPKVYISVSSEDPNYETWLNFQKKNGKDIDDVFLDCIRKNNLLVFRKMINDIRVDPGIQNNEALILCILNKNYTMLSLLLQHPRIQPNDQNNFALRLAINQKDKRILDMLLKDQRVIENIYENQELLSYVWIYQNNGNIII